MIKPLIIALIALVSPSIHGVRAAQVDSAPVGDAMVLRSYEIDERFTLAGTQVAPAMLDALGHRNLSSFLKASSAAGEPSDLGVWSLLRDKYEQFGGSIVKEAPPIGLKASIKPAQQQNPGPLRLEVEIENIGKQPIRLEAAMSAPTATPFYVLTRIVYRGQKEDGTEFSFEERLWLPFPAGTVLQGGEKINSQQDGRPRLFRLGTRSASYTLAALISFSDGKKVQFVSTPKQEVSYAVSLPPQLPRN